MYSSLSDTLVHIVEGYISTKSTKISKHFSKLAFNLFQENVFKVIDGKRFKTFRSSMGIKLCNGGYVEFIMEFQEHCHIIWEHTIE